MHASRTGQGNFDDNVALVEHDPATAETFGGEDSTPVAVLKKTCEANATKRETKDAGEQRLSCVVAALNVLSESCDPMNAQEFITAMEAKTYWTNPCGKTPNSTMSMEFLLGVSGQSLSPVV